MILAFQQGIGARRVQGQLAEETGSTYPGRTPRHRSTGARPASGGATTAPSRAMIEENPIRLAYRTAHLLAQQEHRAARLQPRAGRFASDGGSRARIRAAASVRRPQRALGDGLRPRGRAMAVRLVIDYAVGELLGWHLSRSGRSKTAEAALEQAYRPLRLPEVRSYPFLLRSDNGLVFTSRMLTALVRLLWSAAGIHHPVQPEQNGMVERVIRTLKRHACTATGSRPSTPAAQIPADWIGLQPPALTRRSP